MSVLYISSTDFHVIHGESHNIVYLLAFYAWVEVIDSDYVMLAESKGIYGSQLIFRHVLRNALIPVVTVLAPLVVDLLTGALVVEKIYGIQGIGKLMVDAISGEGIDYNVGENHLIDGTHYVFSTDEEIARWQRGEM